MTTITFTSDTPHGMEVWPLATVTRFDEMTHFVVMGGR
jgi:hypothetical protein